MRSLIFLLLLSFNATAALYDRENGLIYDDVLDITWLQDANYAQTSGYDNDGKMSWADAKAWSSNLSFEGAETSDLRLGSRVYVRVKNHLNWADLVAPFVTPLGRSGVTSQLICTASFCLHHL